MIEEKKYTPKAEEDYKEFMSRVISDQKEVAPMRILEQLVEIAVAEIKSLTFDISATSTIKNLTISIRHRGRQIDDHMIRIMEDHTDRVTYRKDDDEWVLTLRRDFPYIY